MRGNTSAVPAIVAGILGARPRQTSVCLLKDEIIFIREGAKTTAEAALELSVFCRALWVFAYTQVLSVDGSTDGMLVRF